MNQSQEGLADEVTGLAGRFMKQEDLSIREMLRRTGYHERRESLTAVTIRMALAKNPERLSEWLEYSADKRSGSGWYIQEENGQCEVGYFDSHAGFTKQENYSDLVAACADFIQRELDQIALK